jgi:hypothetical protein
MRRRGRCGVALGRRTTWPMIGGDCPDMSYRGRSGVGFNGLGAAT